LPAGRLGLIDVTGCQHRVRPDDEVEDVSQPVRGIHLPPPAGLKAYAQARGSGLEGVDRRLGGFMRRARDTESLLVPQVDPGLVADLDWGRQVTEELVPGLDHCVLGLPGKVGAVEIGQVIVQDPGLSRPTGHHVPHRLIQASRYQIPVRKAQNGRPGEHLGQRRVVQENLPERSHLLINREPAVVHDYGLPAPAPAPARVTVSCSPVGHIPAPQPVISVTGETTCRVQNDIPFQCGERQLGGVRRNRDITGPGYRRYRPPGPAVPYRGYATL